MDDTTLDLFGDGPSGPEGQAIPAGEREHDLDTAEDSAGESASMELESLSEDSAAPAEDAIAGALPDDADTTPSTEQYAALDSESVDVSGQARGIDVVVPEDSDPDESRGDSPEIAPAGVEPGLFGDDPALTPTGSGGAGVGVGLGTSPAEFGNPNGDRPRRRSARQRKDRPSTERRVALVTGASRGIGRGIALALARERWFVVVNYAGNVEAAEETLALVRAAGGDGVAVQGDVSNAENRARMVASALEATGRIDLLVNNAGIAPPVRADLLEVAEADWAKVLDVNLSGTFFLTQLVAKSMVEMRQPGETPRIVMVSSISAETVSVNRGAYCVSKAGVSMLTKLFASRLAGEGIAVHEVRPGVIETDMTAGVREKYDRLVEDGAWPIARWGTPEDVGRAVAALARGDFPFSTGDVFHVDGGWHLRRL